MTNLRELEPELTPGGEEVGVVPELLQPADEAFRAVRAVNDVRLDDFDAGDEVVVVGVVREGDGVVHSQPEACSRVHRPAGDCDGGGAGDVSESGGFLRHRGNDDRALARPVFITVLRIIAEPAVVLLLDLAHTIDQRMLQDADVGSRHEFDGLRQGFIERLIGARLRPAQVALDL